MQTKRSISFSFLRSLLQWTKNRKSFWTSLEVIYQLFFLQARSLNRIFFVFLSQAWLTHRFGRKQENVLQSVIPGNAIRAWHVFTCLRFIWGYFFSACNWFVYVKSFSCSGTIENCVTGFSLATDFELRRFLESNR